MTVNELIQELRKFPGDRAVLVLRGEEGERGMVYSEACPMVYKGVKTYPRFSCDPKIWDDDEGPVVIGPKGDCND